jgi:hypothetical protein
MAPEKKKTHKSETKKKWTNWGWMKKCSPSHGQNGQLVHWWVLAHSGPALNDVTLGDLGF